MTDDILKLKSELESALDEVETMKRVLAICKKTMEHMLVIKEFTEFDRTKVRDALFSVESHGWRKL